MRIAGRSKETGVVEFQSNKETIRRAQRIATGSRASWKSLDNDRAHDSHLEATIPEVCGL